MHDHIGETRQEWPGDQNTWGIEALRKNSICCLTVMLVEHQRFFHQCWPPLLIKVLGHPWPPVMIPWNNLSSIFMRLIVVSTFHPRKLMAKNRVVSWSLLFLFYFCSLFHQNPQERHISVQGKKRRSSEIPVSFRHCFPPISPRCSHVLTIYSELLINWL